MLIEQIVELQVRGPGPPGLTCTSINWLFSWQNKNLEEKSLSGLSFTAKMLHEIMYLNYFPLPGANHVQLNFNAKMQDVKRVLDLNCN